MPLLINQTERDILSNLITKADIPESRIFNLLKIEKLDELKKSDYQSLLKKLEVTIESANS